MSQAEPCPGRGFGCRRQHPLARLGQAARRCVRESDAVDPWLGIERRRCAEGHAGHEAGGRQGIIRDPVDEPAHRVVEGRAVEHLGDRPQLARIDIVGLPVPDDACDLPRPERDLDDRPGLDGHAVRHLIGVRPIAGQRDKNRHGGRRKELAGLIQMTASGRRNLGGRGVRSFESLWSRASLCRRPVPRKESRARRAAPRLNWRRTR